MPNRRRNYLLVLFVAMLVLTFGDRLWVSYYETPMEELGNRSRQYARQIREAQQTVKAYNVRANQLDSLEQRSLPGDPEVARTVYQKWLNGLAEQYELVGPRIDSTSPKQRNGFQVLPFSLHATTTVNQLTQLLAEFYQANTLHRIRSLSISPVDRIDRVAFNASIEAVIVDSTANTGEFPAGRSQELALNDAGDYRLIAVRNFFSPTGGGASLNSTFLTAIVSVNGVGEAWFTSAGVDDTLKIRVGEVLELAGLFARVTEIRETEILLDSGDGLLLLKLNQPLSEAEPLAPPRIQAS